ncbi:helix-turn-helix transcriptional regulator [Kurthia sibirica]|uniref:Transcriptional regulator n=1 Tax=Kurthia sibirica TaxID=202750 RepID=A0A2U3AL63_9BACL|nr:helix-turn-helix transcriptional regulator [Kurthia sibirica]PWI25275.1 transcriptional regulator [Kurthia sibirica]GEK35637.1 transcriptional regulator [Kurthia sibirica]
MENNIKKLRQEQGYTQEELAGKMAVSRQTIISLEKGIYNPSLSLAFKLAIGFNCSIETIFIYESEEER